MAKYHGDSRPPGHRIVRTVAACAVAVSGTVLGVVTTAPAADAAVVRCNSDVTVRYGAAYTAIMPNNSSVSGKASLDCQMGKGSTGQGVRRLQHVLRYCYGESIAQDGIFGDKTKAAVERMQRKERVTVDGIYGPQTRKAMLWHVSYGDRDIGCHSPGI